MKVNKNSAFRYTYWLITITAAIRLFLAWWSGLGIGEAYYFRGAKELALSYFDQPPLFLWLGGLSIRFFGESSLALRLPSVFLFAGTSWVLFLIAKKLYSARAGFFAVALINISIVFTVPVATWFQPDAPLMFFWILCAYFIVLTMFPGHDTNEPSYRHSKEVYLNWGLIGLFLGFTTLSKYHAAFLLLGVLLFTMSKPRHRHWIKHPGPYLAIFINLLVSLPIFIWNADNEWVSFVFQGSRAGSGNGFSLHPLWFARNILGQALWLAPWIWVPLIMTLIRSYKNRKENDKAAFFFWTSVLPIVFFTVITLWSNTQYHFHWQAPGYMMLFIPLGAWAAKRLDNPHRAKKTRRWLFLSAIFTVVLAGVFTTHMVTGFWQNHGPRWIVQQFGGKHDPTIEGVDFDEIRDRFKDEGWLEQDSLFVGTVRWWQTGKVDWALKAELPLVIFNDDPRNFAFFADPADLPGYDCVIVTMGNANSVKSDVKPFFEKVEKRESIPIKRAGVTELEMDVYYATGFKLPEKKRPWFHVYRQLKGQFPFEIGN